MAEVAWDELDAAPAPQLAPLEGATRADVCVVGLGASGLAAASHLARRGADVVALDAVGIGAGAAGRNGGFLLAGAARFHHHAVAAWGRAVAVAIHRATEDELDRTAAAHPGVVRPTGSLRLAASRDELTDCRAHLDALRHDGIAAEAYDGPEGAGLLLPQDAAFHPVARCRADAARALAAGARLHAPARVTGIGDGAVTTPTGRVRSAAVVVAVDGGLEGLVPELAGRVRTSRLQMLATAPDAGVDLPRPVYRRWGYDYVQQLPTGEVLLGGCRDRFQEDEWDAPAVPTAAVQACLDRERDRLGVTAAVTHRWAGRSAFTVDGLPVCEELRPRVVVAGGYSGHGNLLGPLCARAAADAALDGGPVRLPWRS